MTESTTLAELVARGVLYVNDGYRTKASELGDHGLPVLRVAEVRDGSIQPAFKDHVRDEFRPKMGDKTSRADDVLITTKGTVGRAAMVSASLPEFVYSPQLCVLRVLDDRVVSPRWLYAWARSPAFQRQADVVAGQTDMAPYINLVDLRQIVVDLPSLPEQHAVAEVLGALDDKIDNCYRVASLADQIFHAEWENRFGELQTNPDLLLRDLCSAQYGFTASATTDPVGPKFLRVMDINKTNWVDWAAVPYCAAEDDARSRYGLRQGDIVVARMADPGKAALVEEAVDAVFASYLVRLSPHDGRQSMFLYGFLKSRYYAEYAAAHASGSVQKNMNAKVIVGAGVGLPTAAKLAEFQEVATPLRQVVTHSLREAALLTQLRGALLPPLISGELRVRDAAALVGEVG